MRPRSDFLLSCGSGFDPAPHPAVYSDNIWIQLPKIMRNHVDPDPQHWRRKSFIIPPLAIFFFSNTTLAFGQFFFLQKLQLLLAIFIFRANAALALTSCHLLFFFPLYDVEKKKGTDTVRTKYLTDVWDR
jgi:hypothetical protein